jgi:hypothetical protein
MNTPVNFEIANLLKEKGFDIPIEFYYNAEGVWAPDPKWDRKLRRNKNGKKENFLDYEDCISAPTIAEVVMWLYEKHGIWIKVDWYNKNNNGIFWSYTLEKIVNYPEPIDYTPQNTIVWNSPTEAYEAAINYSLNNLI